MTRQPEWIDGAEREAFEPPDRNRVPQFGSPRIGPTVDLTDGPLIRGGQGRSARSITLSAIILIVAILGVVAVLV